MVWYLQNSMWLGFSYRTEHSISNHKPWVLKRIPKYVKRKRKTFGEWKNEKGNANLKQGLFQPRRFPWRKAWMPIAEEFWIPFFPLSTVK